MVQIMQLVSSLIGEVCTSKHRSTLCKHILCTVFRRCMWLLHRALWHILEQRTPSHMCAVVRQPFFVTSIPASPQRQHNVLIAARGLTYMSNICRYVICMHACAKSFDTCRTCHMLHKSAVWCEHKLQLHVLYIAAPPIQLC